MLDGLEKKDVHLYLGENFEHLKWYLEYFLYFEKSFLKLGIQLSGGAFA